MELIHQYMTELIQSLQQILRFGILRQIRNMRNLGSTRRDSYRRFILFNLPIFIIFAILTL